MNIKVINAGGVSFEASSGTYRGSVNINGNRYRTKRYGSKRAAQLALTKLKKLVVVATGSLSSGITRF